MAAEAKRRPAVAVEVSGHAREQARARFPGFKAARIVDEVRDAMLEGRFGPEPPPGCENTSDCLFAWTPDERRVYVLRAKWHVMRVVTTLRCWRVAA